MSKTLTYHPRNIIDFGGYTKYEVLEDNKASGRMTVRGRFQAQNLRNANGRIYATPLWDRVLKDEKMLEAITRRRMLGELEHPVSGVTDLNRVSHVITKLWRKGDEILGEAEVLNTPSGKVLQELFRAGVEVGISSRGRGTSYVRNGVEYVNEADFTLDAFDFVYRPSTPGAYPKLAEAVMKNSVYGKDTAMTVKLDEFKRLDVRAVAILKAIGESVDLAKLTAFHTECVEMEATISAIAAGLTEDDVKEHGEYAEEVVGKVLEARAAVTALLDEQRSKADDVLDTRVEDTSVEEAADADEKKTASSKNKNESNKQIERYKSLLAESRQSRDYWKERAHDAVAALSEDGNTLQQRYAAAVSLGEELIARTTEAEQALAELSEAHATLEERYGHAVSLVEEIAKRQDRSRIVNRVAKAIELHSELAKFETSLLRCKTLDELRERLDEYMTALGLSSKDMDEAMFGQVNLSAAQGAPEVEESEASNEDEDDAEAGEDTTREGDLPSKGTTLNESESEVVSVPSVPADTAATQARHTVRLVTEARGWK